MFVSGLSGTEMMPQARKIRAHIAISGEKCAGVNFII